MSVVTRPINISIISTSLLAELKPGVIPRLRPTVLYAETDSKIISNNRKPSSKYEISNEPIPKTTTERVITAKARLMDVSDTSRL